MKNTANLNGKWDLTYAEHGKSPDWKRKYGALVPGDVHLDLMRRGDIPDPYYGDNFQKCAWMEEKDWWYRKEFRIPKDLKKYSRLKLVFDGIDTIATVWLNGKKLGYSDNMFLPVDYDITRVARFGKKNILTVKIHSTIKEVNESKYGGKLRKIWDGIEIWDRNERIYVRKAQYTFGWDIAPRLISAGIWRGVRITGLKDATVEDLYARTINIGEKAGLEVYASVSNNTGERQNISLDIVIFDNNKAVFRKNIDKTIDTGTTGLKIPVVIKNPKLWWPHDMGTPYLYRIEAAVKNEKGVLDKNSKYLGIRKIELIQEKQGDGGLSFYFKINGRKEFIKGVNWVPLEAIPAKVTMERYRKVFKFAKNQNVNCLRIWGGGYYEDDYLYDMCDKEGMLVWQDFMFACAAYPQDSEFLDKVKEEADYIVRHLRSHPSMMLWGGDNEVDMMLGIFYKMDQRKNRINRVILKNAVTNLSPEIPYIYSSPFSRGKKSPWLDTEGDNHIWHHGVYYKDKIYSQDRSRLVSEIGHLSIPDKKSLKKFIPEEFLWPPQNKIWDQHFGTHFFLKFRPKRREKVDQSIKNIYGYVPDNLDEYIKLSQKVQADALVYWINKYMRSKYCGGFIYWNLIDGWPQMTDSVLDYYMNPKPAYFAVKKAFSKKSVIQ